MQRRSNAKVFARRCTRRCNQKEMAGRTTGGKPPALFKEGKSPLFRPLTEMPAGGGKDQSPRRSSGGDALQRGRGCGARRRGGRVLRNVPVLRCPRTLVLRLVNTVSY